MTTILNNSTPISISQQINKTNNNNNNNKTSNGSHPSSFTNSVSPQRKSPILTSIPPPPPSSSLKFPLELSNKNQICNLKINLDKSYFTNGETLSGKINIFLTERQCIKRIKLQLCGYEKIFQHEQYSANTYQTFKFYSGNLNIPPLNVNIDTTISNSLGDSLGNSPMLYSQNGGNGSGVGVNTELSEFESGSYDYPFTFQLPKYLTPSLNYIGYLSIFYLVHCKVEYSKGRDWVDKKIMKSSELWISGINKTYQDYLLRSKTTFSSFKISQYLWQDKSKPIEMAICLQENNCYIGDKATFFFQLKNPLLLKFTNIRVELFQQISFVKSITNNNDRRIKAKIQKLNKQNIIKGSHYDHGSTIISEGNSSSRNTSDKHKVSQTQILLHNYDCRPLLKKNRSNGSPDSIIHTNIQIQIPHKIEDDQVFPSTRGFLSTVKHFFIISIPSVSNFKIKVPIQLWQRFDDYNFTTTTSTTNNNSYNNISNNGNGNGSGGINNNSNNSSSNSLNEGINGSNSSGSFEQYEAEEDVEEDEEQEEELPPQSTSSHIIYDDSDDGDDGNSNKSTLNPPKEWRVLWLPKWKDETTVANCNLCDNAFTIIRRTHHCRSCGGVFCEACSNQKVSLFGFGISQKVRICLMCFDAVKAEANGGIGVISANTLSSISSNASNSMSSSIICGINSINLNNNNNNNSLSSIYQPTNVFSKKKVYKPPFLVHL